MHMSVSHGHVCVSGRGKTVMTLMRKDDWKWPWQLSAVAARKVPINSTSRKFAKVDFCGQAQVADWCSVNLVDMQHEHSDRERISAYLRLLYLSRAVMKPSFSCPEALPKIWHSAASVVMSWCAAGNTNEGSRLTMERTGDKGVRQSRSYRLGVEWAHAKPHRTVIDCRGESAVVRLTNIPQSGPGSKTPGEAPKRTWLLQSHLSYDGFRRCILQPMTFSHHSWADDFVIILVTDSCSWPGLLRFDFTSTYIGQSAREHYDIWVTDSWPDRQRTICRVYGMHYSTSRVDGRVCVVVMHVFILAKS